MLTHHRFDSIRSASAAPLVSGALNPQAWSSSSSLTSTNVWILTSPQTEKRKFAARRAIGRCVTTFLIKHSAERASLLMLEGCDASRNAAAVAGST